MQDFILNHLAQPLFFGVFSIVVGVGYVVIWVVSLHELTKSDRRLVPKKINARLKVQQEERRLTNRTYRKPGSTRAEAQRLNQKNRNSRVRVTRTAARAA